jgi:hypothetical protein
MLFWPIGARLHKQIVTFGRFGHGTFYLSSRLPIVNSIVGGILLFISLAVFLKIKIETVREEH